MKYNVLAKATNGVIRSVNVRFVALNIIDVTVFNDVIIDINLDTGDYSTKSAIVINGKVEEKLAYVDTNKYVQQIVLDIVNKELV